jgi:S-DNA-T family DNA segregation ATPase FtsK/SpoIIIE
MHVVAAGDRQLFATKVSPTTEDKLLLRLNDRNDYGMAGIRVADVPETLPAGRAVRAADADEVQLALLASDPAGVAQAQALHDIGQQTSQRDVDVPPTARPFNVSTLPEKLTFDDADRLPHPDKPLWALLGVGGDDDAVFGVDLSSTATWIVAGPPRSGRSTVLLTMARSLLAGGTEVVVVAHASRSCAAWPGRRASSAPFDRADVKPEDFDAALRSSHGPVVVLVDDARPQNRSEPRSADSLRRRVRGDLSTSTVEIAPRTRQQGPSSRRGRRPARPAVCSSHPIRRGGAPGQAGRRRAAGPGDLTKRKVR